MYFLFWKIFFKTWDLFLGNQHWKWLCISPTVVWFCELAWGVQLRQKWPAWMEFHGSRNPWLRIFFTAAIFEDPKILLCVWRERADFGLFFCQVMFYQWLVLPPLWPQRFRGDISPTLKKRSHDLKDHFFLTLMHSACWFHASKLVENWTFLPFLVKLKAGKHLFSAYVSWMIFEGSAIGKNIPSLIIASLKLDLKIVNPWKQDLLQICLFFETYFEHSPRKGVC